MHFSVSFIRLSLSYFSMILVSHKVLNSFHYISYYDTREIKAHLLPPYLGILNLGSLSIEIGGSSYFFLSIIGENLVRLLFMQRKVGEVSIKLLYNYSRMSKDPYQNFNGQ